ncbi:unnamed protein product [Adineta ricciae]|uniref:Uncharacterized protein n=1 Tax=Adineta ricciae TaxID=249248 RepID=A0A813SJL6_ADIRI|nr:unnamed protein product [Adineta ricciae]CAF1054257.1 unnamed protein product [Adineta ricciae]
MAVLQQRWKNLAVSVADAILTISMNRPKVNAMSAELLNDLEQAFDHASKDVTIKGVHLRSNFSSTFCAGLDLANMYDHCSKRQKPIIDKFLFETVARGVSAPFRCSKPVACSLEGHAIAGGLILALACDYIAVGTRKPFSVGVTEITVGVPFPTIPLEIVRHQLEPQLAHRIILDANLISIKDFPHSWDKSETPDDLSRKWLKMIMQRPLQGFQITKEKWWSNVTKLIGAESKREKEDFLEVITSNECVEAMKKMLKK